MSLMSGARAIKKSTFKRQYDPEARKKGLNVKQKRQVVKVIRQQQEMKYAWITGSTSFGGTGAGTGPITTQLTQIPQGDTDQQRDGDKFRLIRHRFRAFVHPGSQTLCQVRVIVFQWFPTSTPVIASILITGGTGSIDVTSEYNHDRRQEYRILMDKMLTAGTSEGAGAQKAIKHIYNYKDKHANCQMNAGSTVDGTNQVWLIAISDTGAATYPSLKYTMKFFFTDS